MLTGLAERAGAFRDTGGAGLVLWAITGPPEPRSELGAEVSFRRADPAKKLEAASGFEPENNGFADRRLSHLAMPPHGARIAADGVARRIPSAHAVLNGAEDGI